VAATVRELVLEEPAPAEPPEQPPAADASAATKAETSLGGRRLAAFLGLSLLLAAGISVGLVWWAHSRHLELLPTLRAVGWQAIALALLLHLGAHLAWSGRLTLVGHGTGDGIRFGFAFRLVTAGVFGAAITPGRTGGEGLRFLLLRRHHPEPDHALRFLLADRTLDLCFFVAAGIPASIVLPRLVGADQAYRAVGLIGVAVFAAVLGVLVLLVVNPAALRRLGAPLERPVRRLMPRRGPSVARAVERGLAHTRDGLRILLTERRSHLAGAAVLTVAYWLLEFLVLAVLLRAFGAHVPLLAVLLGAVVLNLVTAAAITPGASGIAELTALAIYQGMAPGLSPLFVVLWRLVTYGYDLAIGGLVAVREGMLTVGRRRRRTASA
jgi:uncharacterized protein (TIRG00374 family)